MAQAPACKSDVKFNFATASDLDDIVYGSARPGAIGQRCYNPEDKVTAAEVGEFASYMGQQGVKRVVGLLTSSEIQTYERPPAEMLKELGMQAANFDVDADPARMAKIFEELKAAEDAKEKVVVHCWGGGGRAGRVLAAYLVKRHGLSPEEAAQVVVSHAKAQGASRRVDMGPLQKLLDGCSA